MNKIEDNKSIVSLWVMFIIYPLLSFYFAVKNFEVKQYRIFILLFGMLYGLTFIPIEESDATRYSERINIAIGDYTFSRYSTDIYHMYDKDAEYNDAYFYTVVYLLNNFTNNIVIYRIFFTTIYFLVLMKLISTLIELVRKDTRIKPYSVFLIGVVFLLSLSSGINGVRFPLGLQVFLLGVLLYLKNNKIQYLFLAMAAFFVHFMFGLVALFLGIFYFTKKYYNPIIILVFTIVVFSTSLVIASSLQSSASNFGGGLENKVNTYSENDDYKDERNNHLKEWNWYLQFDRYSAYYFCLVAMVFLVAKRKFLYKDSLALNLEYVTFLMFMVSFISGGIVDELSNRYYILAIGTTLMYLYYLSSFKENKAIMKTLNTIFIPIIILHILIGFRADLYTVSPVLVLGNFILTFFIESTVSIQELFFS